MPARASFITVLGIAAIFSFDAAFVSAAAPQAPRVEKPNAVAEKDKAAAPADDIAADLAALQGTWYREFTNTAGVTLRIEKKVDGESDVVTHFDAKGNVTHSHASKFELERHGPFRVFVVKDSVATAGPNMGMQQAGRRSFAYRIEGDRMIEAWGLLDADRGPPSTFVWLRLKIDDAAK
ncbi:MAG: hypothetical protein QM775_23580 [Pirellulales bacterium]